MTAIAVPRARHATPALSRVLTFTVHALGVAAFAYPFFLTRAVADERAAHASDAPVLFSIFGALLIAIAASEIRAGAMDARGVALLGVLAGVNAMLRVPGSFGGASLMFVLPILCGYAFGARFGFLVGASSMAAGGLITGGVGPWLPFQMWALGWVGGGAGIIRAALGQRVGWGSVAALAAYGWIAGYVFGALTNLWFWPFQVGTGPLQWSPGLGPAESLAHYGRFYLVTSLAWDSTRALGNAVLIVAIGRPVLRLLVRAAGRLDIRWEEPVPATR